MIGEKARGHKAAIEGRAGKGEKTDSPKKQIKLRANGKEKPR